MTRGPAASKVALVTGATRGIGRAIALELARHNFAVVVTGRTLAEGQGVAPGSIEGVVSAIHEGGGAALGVRLDLLDRSSIETAMAATMDRFGRLDVLVNNGIYQGPEMMLPVADFSMTAAEDNFRGMVVNQIYASRLAIAAMRRQGQGRLVFMGSLAATSAPNGHAGLLYAAGKAAFHRIPAYIHYEHAKDGILAFLVEPQFTMTDTLRARLGDQAEAIGAGFVARRPEETARTVAWLASHPDAARFAGGELINAPDFFIQSGVDPRRNGAVN